MNSSDLAPSLLLVNKLAENQKSACTSLDPVHFVSGFMTYLIKEAKLSESDAFGIVCYFADQESIKQAGLMDSIKGQVKGFVGPENYNHIKAVYHNPAAAAKGAVIGAEHPGLINTAEQINKGDWGSVAKDIGNKAVNWISNPDNLKTVARYAAPGIATYLGAKTVGLGTGDSLLAGAAGAVGGNYLYNNWDEVKKKFEPAPVLNEPAQTNVASQVTQQQAQQQSVQQGAQRTLDNAVKPN